MDTKNQAQQSITIKDLECFSDLSADEQAMLNAGFGWDDIKKGIKKGYDKVSGGVKRIGQGLKDGSGDSSSRYDDLWYNLGYFGGQNVTLSK